jgi:hypothetical protein
MYSLEIFSGYKGIKISENTNGFKEETFHRRQVNIIFKNRADLLACPLKVLRIAQSF